MELTKTCNKCNETKTLDLFYTNKKYHLGVLGTCRKKEYRLSNLEFMRFKSRLKYENNKQKTLEINKRYRKNNPEKMRELSKKDYKRSSENLTDRYVRNIMKRHYPLVKEIPQEIIELKRIIIKTYRLCQQLQN